MVALAVRTFGQRPVTCHARPMLFRSYADLEAGRIIEAGCRLREAVRLYLVAECEYFNCLPSKKQQKSIPRLLNAILKCDDVPNFETEWLEEMISYGNALAHCKFVAPKYIETSLSIMHMILDDARHLQQPAAAGRLS
jgi:hypothetical protein